jgi:hypothetical protein
MGEGVLRMGEAYKIAEIEVFEDHMRSIIENIFRGIAENPKFDIHTIKHSTLDEFSGEDGIRTETEFKISTSVGSNSKTIDGEDWSTQDWAYITLTLTQFHRLCGKMRS